MIVSKEGRVNNEEGSVPESLLSDKYRDSRYLRLPRDLVRDPFKPQPERTNILRGMLVLVLTLGNGPERISFPDKSRSSKYLRFKMLSGNFPYRLVLLRSSNLREEEILR
ncbi:hypothetical protein Hanom_Chr14g01329091 [Helianthus anomalus]